MIDEQERAARVWREACAAYEDGTAATVDLPMRDMVIAGDRAATAVIAADRAELVAEVKRLREAVMAVVSAIRSYLPPDGISEQECLNRIIAATDNPIINPIILEAENGCN